MIKRIGFTGLAVLALSVAAQAADMESGTWVLNVAKSTNNTARSATHVISRDGGWRIIKRQGVDKDGKPTSSNSIGKQDGIARPSIGNGAGGVGTLATATKSDDFHFKHTSVAITGKARRTQVLVISPDGKVMTNTITDVDNDGKTSNRVAVFDKQ